VVPTDLERPFEASFYLDCDYTTLMGTLAPGSYNAMSLSMLYSELFNLRSLKVHPGFSVTLYAGDNFQGDSRVIREDTPCLDSFNDATTSLVFMQDGGWP
jgi:hypothetical protein